MQRFRKILMGIDLAVSDRLLDPTGHRTRDALSLQKAVWLAHACGAELRIVTALPLSARARALDERAQRAGGRSLVHQAERRLLRLAEEVIGPEVSTSVRARIGQAVPTLLDEASAWGADVIVVGAGEAAGPGAGTGVATELFRSASVPVWIARRGVPDAIQNVLAAVALDEHSHGVLRLASSFAQRIGADLHVLHVIEDGVAGSGTDGARRTLEDWLEANAPNVHLADVRVERGDPARSIVAVAEGLPADVVMIGPSNRSRLMAALEGRPSVRLSDTLFCSLVCAGRVPNPRREARSAEPAKELVASLSD